MNLEEIKRTFLKIKTVPELFDALPGLISPLNALYFDAPNATPGHIPLVLVGENQRINPKTGKVEDITIPRAPQDHALPAGLMENGIKKLDCLKKHVEETKNTEEFFEYLEWFIENINLLYFYQENPNFDYPPRLLLFYEGQSFLARDGRIWLKRKEYEHFGIYGDQNGNKVLFRDVDAYYPQIIYIHKPEPLLERAGYSYHESLSFEYETLTPLHQLSHPKSFKEVLDDPISFSVERIQSPVGITWHSKTSRKTLPSHILRVHQGIYFRPHPGGDWIIRSNGTVARAEALVNEGEFEALVKRHFRFWIKPFTNPINEGEKHITYLQIGGDPGPADFELTVYQKGNKEKVKNFFKERAARRRGQKV